MAEPDDEGQRLLEMLTPREVEVLVRVADGEDTRLIAAGMGIAPSTARTHVQRVLMKLGVGSRLEAAALAARTGLLDRATTAGPGPPPEAASVRGGAGRGGGCPSSGRRETVRPKYEPAPLATPLRANTPHPTPPRRTRPRPLPDAHPRRADPPSGGSPCSPSRGLPIPPSRGQSCRWGGTGGRGRHPGGAGLRNAPGLSCSAPHP